MKLDSDSYFIQQPYHARQELPLYYPTSVEDKIWQPEVYILAQTIARELGCRCVIDVGCGQGQKLAAFHPEFEIVGVDFGENIAYCQQHYNFGTWLDHDLETENSIAIEPAWLENALVICSDVIEHLVNPQALIDQLLVWSKTARALLISTPDRMFWSVDQAGPPDNPHHVREWTLEEFRTFLIAAGFSLSTAAYTISNTQDMKLWTILAIVGEHESDRVYLQEALFRYRASQRSLPLDPAAQTIFYERLHANTQQALDALANAHFRLQGRYQALENGVMSASPPLYELEPWEQQDSIEDYRRVLTRTNIYLRELETRVSAEREAVQSEREKELNELKDSLDTYYRNELINLQDSLDQHYANVLQAERDQIQALNELKDSLDTYYRNELINLQDSLDQHYANVLQAERDQIQAAANQRYEALLASVRAVLHTASGNLQNQLRLIAAGRRSRPLL